MHKKQLSTCSATLAPWIDSSRMSQFLPSRVKIVSNQVPISSTSDLSDYRRSEVKASTSFTATSASIFKRCAYFPGGVTSVSPATEMS